MKRIYFAIIFLVFSICLGFFEQKYVIKSVDTITNNINKTDEYILNKNYENALDTINTAEKKWDNSISIFDMMLNHNNIDKISVDIAVLKSCVENKSEVDYFLESAEIKKELKSIKDSECIYFENIF